MGFISFILGQTDDEKVKAPSTLISGSASSSTTLKDNSVKTVVSHDANHVSIQNIDNYDINMFFAKVAICKYIAIADSTICDEEMRQIESVFKIAKNMYGRQVVAEARKIHDLVDSSIFSVEPYLRKLNYRDLKSFVLFAEEMAKTDKKVKVSEEKALEKLKQYVQSQSGKTTSNGDSQIETGKSINDEVNLSCPCCAAPMKLDAYGYKAECLYCGFEKLIDSKNAPENKKMIVRETIVNTVKETQTKTKKSTGKTTGKNEIELPTKPLTMPKIPTRPNLPQRQTEDNMREYRRALTRYEKALVKYKRDFEAYQAYVISHPN